MDLRIHTHTPLHSTRPFFFAVYCNCCCRKRMSQASGRLFILSHLFSNFLFWLIVRSARLGSARPDSPPPEYTYNSRLHSSSNNSKSTDARILGSDVRILSVFIRLTALSLSLFSAGPFLPSEQCSIQCCCCYCCYCCFWIRRLSLSCQTGDRRVLLTNCFRAFLIAALRFANPLFFTSTFVFNFLIKIIWKQKGRKNKKKLTVSFVCFCFVAAPTVVIAVVFWPG